MIAMRPYQLDAIERTRQALRDGKQRPLLVAPTGSGKTVIAVSILTEAIARGKRVLVAAHRRELIKQPFAKLVRAGLAPEHVGVIMAQTPTWVARTTAHDAMPDDDDSLWERCARRRPHAPIQIASIDTVRHRTKPPADLLVIDEAHRALAKSYVDLVAEYPGTPVLGMTATPIRSDGRGLGAMFDALIIVASYAELVNHGFLVEPSVWSVPSSSLPDLSDVPLKRSGDYDEKHLAVAVDRAGLVGDIVEHYLRRGNDQPAFAFAVSVEHSRHIVERFRSAGVAADHVDADTPKAERDAALRRLRAGEVKVLSNVDVFTEGTDVVQVKTVILARPTKSVRVYLQQVGRGSRPFEGRPFVVLDHAGCAREHGLPQEHRDWILDAKKRRASGASAPPAKTCPDCFAVVPSRVRVCYGELADGTLCLYEWPAPEGRDLEERDGQLVELRPQTTEEKWAAIVADWQRRNAKRKAPLKPGWCAYRWRDLHKCPLPRSCKLPALTDEQIAARARLDALKAEGEAKGYAGAWAHVQMAGGVH